VLAHAAALRRAGHDRAAEAVVRDAWRIAPHPDLAAFLLEPAPDAPARLRAAAALSNLHPDHVETQYLLARLHLAAGELREARHHAERARGLAAPTRRVLVLLADILAAEGGDPAALLRAAAAAPADPAWRCGACGTKQPRWHLACPACHAPARMSWHAGGPGPTLAIAAPR
jgi:HemY protein